jgi:hypothetical protein
VKVNFKRRFGIGLESRNKSKPRVHDNIIARFFFKAFKVDAQKLQKLLQDMGMEGYKVIDVVINQRYMFSVNCRIELLQNTSTFPVVVVDVHEVIFIADLENYAFTTGSGNLEMANMTKQTDVPTSKIVKIEEGLVIESNKRAYDAGDGDAQEKIDNVSKPSNKRTKVTAKRGGK